MIDGGEGEGKQGIEGWGKFYRTGLKSGPKAASNSRNIIHKTCEGHLLSCCKNEPKIKY